MFRRIEFIGKSWKLPEDGYFLDYWYKQGLLGLTTQEVADAFMPETGPSLRGPWGKRNPSIKLGSRFFFTELGWDKIGRNVVAAAQKSGQEYRIIAVKETDAQIVWRDSFTNYEVALRPKINRRVKHKNNYDY